MEGKVLNKNLKIDIDILGEDSMAKLISVPDWLYDELKIMKKEASKKAGHRISFSETMELKYNAFQRHYDNLKKKCL